MNAARLGAEHGLPLADSVILATALSQQAIIWTKDSHFKGIPGVKFLD
jgi:predicted nucleic acid-binding protein